MFAAHIALVWLLPFLPTQDGPSHVYNLVILHDLINGGADWGTLFSYRLRPAPNLGFMLLAYPLLSVVPPLVAEKLFVTIYIALLGCSVPVMLRALERPVFPLALLVLPVVFNFNLLMGFYSYSLAVPLFVLALAWCWAARSRSWGHRFFVCNASGLVLFVVHLVPCLLFVLAIVVMAGVRSIRGKTWRADGLRWAAIMSPLLLLIAGYLASSSFAPPTTVFDYFSVSRYVLLLIEVLTFSSLGLSPWLLLPATPLMFLFLLFGYCSLQEMLRLYRRRAEVADRELTLWALALLLVAICLFAPNRVAGGDYFNDRIPWVILLVLLPALRVPETDFWRRFATPIVVGSVVLVSGFTSAILVQRSAKIEAFVAGVQPAIPRGAFVMSYLPRAAEPFRRVNVLTHALALHCLVEKCVVAGDNEIEHGYFPTRFKLTVPRLPGAQLIAYAPQTISWSEYPALQYVVGWRVDPESAGHLGQSFELVGESGQTSVWQRRESSR